MGLVATRLGRWFYEERGASHGPTIVLLHGLFFDRRMWERQVPALAALGRVIVFDGPGHGGSDVPPPFTLEDQADALAEALDALRISSAIVIGLSWGAMVALRLAISHPARVLGLAVLGASADLERRRDVAAHRVVNTIGGRFRVPSLVARRVLLPMILSPGTLRDQPELVDHLVGVMRSQPPLGVARASLAVVGRVRRITSAVSSIRVRSLVLCGEDDRTTPVSQGRRIADSIPAARLLVVPGCGHLSAVERPDEITRALCTLVSDVR